MHHFDPPPPPPSRHREMWFWFIGVAILVVPGLLVMAVRGAAAGFKCVPGPQICHGLPIGDALKYALQFSWFIAMDTLFSIGVAFVASLAALKARRPLLAALTMLITPMLALVLPWLGVYTSLYPDCAPNEEGVGDCVLWGTHMGMSVHNAATAEQIVFGNVAYTFAIALMIGALGLLFFRPHNR
ncbi:MAG TPA: hypothetical protein VGM36_11275 [Rhizomicrobium sp.]|jgi:hypothetical protein